MQTIILQQSIKITGINKKTNALFFREIEIGDTINLSIIVEPLHYYNHPPVTSFSLFNERSKSMYDCTNNLLIKHLSNFEFIILE